MMNHSEPPPRSKDGMSAPSRKGFEPVRAERLFEKVCEQIRRKLASGELKPGDRLPPEREFAIELGVGRAAVREAFKTLQVSGLLELRMGVKGGAYIREGNIDVLTRSLVDLMTVGRITMKSLAEARSEIHGLVVRRACERATEADFAALEENLRQIDEFAAAGDLKRRSDAAVEFFRLVARATRNEVLELLVDSLAHLIRIAVLDRTPPTYRPELVPVRRRIVDAWRARDVGGATAEMDRYLQVVHAPVLGASRQPPRARARAGPAPRRSVKPVAARRK